MLRFNIQQAKKDGLSDEEITRIIQQGPPGQTQSQTKQPTAQGGKGNLLTQLLPLLGSLVGGGVGAFGGPAGAIAGSAAGSGLGEFARQSLTGEDISGKRIAGETALGGIGGAAGQFLGGAFRGTKAAQAIKGAKAAKTVKAGSRIAAKPYTGEAVKKLRGRNVAPRAEEIGQTATELKGMTSPAKLASLAKQRESLNTILGKKTTKAGGLTVSGKDLLKTIKSEAGESAIDLTSGPGKAALRAWGPKIQKTKSVEELSGTVEKLLVRLQEVGLKSGEGRVLNTFKKPLQTELNRLAKTSDEFAQLSKLNAAEPIIQSQAGKQARVFGTYETQLPFRAQEVGQSLAGGVAKAASSPLAKNVAGQAGVRAFGGGGEAGEDYIQQNTMPTPASQYQLEPDTATDTMGLNLTPETVALARLTLPTKQADAIEAAYKILHPTGEKTTEAQIARDEMSFLIDDAFTQLSGGGVKTGIIEPRLEELKSVFNAGDQTTIDFNRTISALTAAIAKARAGTSFTANEQKLLERYAPKIGDSAQQLLSKLSGLQSIVVNRQR